MKQVIDNFLINQDGDLLWDAPESSFHLKPAGNGRVYVKRRGRYYYKDSVIAAVSAGSDSFLEELPDHYFLSNNIRKAVDKYYGRCPEKCRRVLDLMDSWEDA